MRFTKTAGMLLCALGLTGCVGNEFTRSIERADQSEADAAKRRLARTEESVAADDLGDEPVSVLAVNGHDITVEEVLGPIRTDLRDRVKRMAPAQYREHMVGAVNGRVGLMIRDTLLFREAEKDISDQESQYLDGLVDQEVRKRVNAEFAGRQTRFERELAASGSSLADERERIRRQLVIMRWLQGTVYRKVADPTRDELMRIFEAQKGEFAKPPRRDMLIIEVSVESKLPAGAREPGDDVLSECRGLARESARAARAALLGGAEFATVAGEYSTGWHKEKGGRWGWVSRGSVRETLEPAVDALFNLPATGVPSEVVETPHAFYIVQAAAIDPGVQADFAELQPELVARFRETQFNKIVDGTVRRLQEEAHYRPQNVNRFVHAVLVAAPQPEGFGARSPATNP